MTYAARKQRPEGRATQSCLGPASRNGSTFRCCRTTGTRLFHFAASGVSLPRACSATEKTDPCQRNQVGVYRQASTKPDSAGPSIRRNQAIVHQRGGQPGVARATAARARAWVSRNQIGHGAVVWNIDLIVCCRRNWHKSTSCWSRKNGGQWAEAQKGLRNHPSPSWR
jgi:hypothetical protein